MRGIGRRRRTDPDVGFRFRRSIRIFPGLRLNLGKRGVSASIGVRGAHVTVGPTGTRTTVGLPGSGVSYTTMSRPHHEAPGADAETPASDAADADADAQPHAVRWWVLIALLVVCAIVLAVSGCGQRDLSGGLATLGGAAHVPLTTIKHIDTSARLQPCQQYPGAEHFAETCAVEFRINAEIAGPWSRLDCFGELTFTQIYEGRVLKLPHGFYEGFRHEDSDPVAMPLKLVSFTYFPKSYGALDPALEWYKCDVQL